MTNIQLISVNPILLFVQIFVSKVKQEIYFSNQGKLNCSWQREDLEDRQRVTWRRISSSLWRSPFSWCLSARLRLHLTRRPKMQIKKAQRKLVMRLHQVLQFYVNNNNVKIPFCRLCFRRSVCDACVNISLHSHQDLIKCTCTDK